MSTFLILPLMTAYPAGSQDLAEPLLKKSYGYAGSPASSIRAYATVSTQSEELGPIIGNANSGCPRDYRLAEERAGRTAVLAMSGRRRSGSFLSADSALPGKAKAP